MWKVSAGNCNVGQSTLLQTFRGLDEPRVCWSEARQTHFTVTLLLSAVYCDRLCGLLVRVPGYRSRVPGSIPGATRFSHKQWVWNAVHSSSWVRLRRYLKEKVADPVKKIGNTAIGIYWADYVTPPLSAKVGTNFVDKLRSLGRRSSLAD
jgi:hypothetical protein